MRNPVIIGSGRVFSLKNRICNFLRKLNKGTKKISEVPNTDPPTSMTHPELVRLTKPIPSWDKKIEFFKQFEYSAALGKWVVTTLQERQTSEKPESTISFYSGSLHKVNYGCGSNLLDGWLNVDLYPGDASHYMQLDLLDKHPFSDKSISFGFAEDLLEHFSQAQSILFMNEISRTFVKGGVLRLSYPSLEGVLKKHYFPSDEARVRNGEFEAYVFWDHIHFYSNEELRLLAQHLGFQNVEFVTYGESRYPELCGLDTRYDQIGLNAYVELTK